MLVVTALLEPDHRFLLSLGIRLRDSKPPSFPTFAHQIREIQLWCFAETISCEMNVVRRTGECPSGSRMDADQFSIHCARSLPHDARRSHIAASEIGKYFVALGNFFHS